MGIRVYFNTEKHTAVFCWFCQTFLCWTYTSGCPTNSSICDSCKIQEEREDEKQQSEVEQEDRLQDDDSCEVDFD
jgi:hypothetical protein